MQRLAPRATQQLVTADNYMSQMLQIQQLLKHNNGQFGCKKQERMLLVILSLTLK